MSGLSGADVERLEGLAATIERRADLLDGVTRSATAGLRASNRFWVGSAAEHYRQTWFRHHGPALARCADDLRTMAALVRRNALAQQLASAAGTDGTGTGRRIGRGGHPGGPGPAPSPPGTELGNGFSFGDTGGPEIRHDNGFLQNPDDPDDPVPLPTRPPTGDEQAYYDSEVRRALGADYLSELPLIGRIDDRLALEHGIEAYRHFLTGDGEPRTFDYETYLDDDASGQVARSNAITLARIGADDTYRQLVDQGLVDPAEPVTFTITSDPYGVGGSSSFPYPDSEDWQKAIGGHTMWSVTEITYAPNPEGGVVAEATVTLHAEDRYNFNPGQQDIATQVPDSRRGVLEEAGLARQYDQTGSVTYTTSWLRGAPNDPIVELDQPPR